MSDRNVAEFTLALVEISEFCLFGRETPLGNGESKEELLRYVRQCQQRKNNLIQSEGHNFTIYLVQE